MTSSIATVRTVRDLRAEVAKWRKAGETVALVPTMGALHAGHLSLIGIAKNHATRIVASIFVNPAQFGPKEDFKRYPRDEAGDLAKLAQAGVHLVYIPDTAEMYPQGFATKVSLPSLTEDLCGAARPNHFEGVATVVTKLLLQCAPDVAVFGEKDYQQLLVIKQLVRDLNIPVQIIPGPILREEDGLALSSRNGYLSLAERRGDQRRPVQARGQRLSRRLCCCPRSRDAGAAVRSDQRAGAGDGRRLSRDDAPDRQRPHRA
jgi:pantoate--beta-alanine ligase